MQLQSVLLLFPFIAFPLLARGEDLKGDFSQYLKALSRLEDQLRTEPGCEAYVEDGKPGCSRLTDNYCSVLWNAKNKGSLEVHDGQVQIGYSPTSKTRLYVLEHYRAMVDSLPRLPEDVRKRAEPALLKLKEALDEEPSLKGDTTAWQRKVNDALISFDRAVIDAALARKKKAFPETMKKAPEDRSNREKLELAGIEETLADQVLDARYGEHPNWKRVERVYAQVKDDILKEIDSLDIPEKQKQIMADRIRDARLTLPYTASDKGSNEKECGSTQVNAYYFRNRNQLVVCAGFFNSHKTESALYFVIAHELGHSLDPNGQAEYETRKVSPVSEALARLIASPGPAYSCDDWRKLKTEGPLKAPEGFRNQRESHPLEKLTACLKDRSHLEPLTFEGVRGAVDRMVRRTMSSYASGNWFLKIAQPTMTQYGELKENDFYLRPDILVESWEGKNSDGRLQRDVDPLEIFNQALSCQTVEVDGKSVGYKDNPDPAVRAQIFGRALEETAGILKIKEMDSVSYCGQSCRSLVAEGMAADASENFADWIGIRASRHYLARISSLEDKREASVLATSLFCREPSLYNDAPDLALVEKSFSLQQHPDDRIRRVSFYSLETAKLLGCAVDPDAQGYALCEP